MPRKSKFPHLQDIAGLPDLDAPTRIPATQTGPAPRPVRTKKVGTVDHESSCAPVPPPRFPTRQEARERMRERIRQFREGARRGAKKNDAA